MCDVIRHDAGDSVAAGHLHRGLRLPGDEPDRDDCGGAMPHAFSESIAFSHATADACGYSNPPYPNTDAYASTGMSIPVPASDDRRAQP